jgi:hypothetical protein
VLQQDRIHFPFSLSYLDGHRDIIEAADAIAAACDILRSAIGDLREIIHQIDGQKHLLPAIAVHRIESRS